MLSTVGWVLVIVGAVGIVGTIVGTARNFMKMVEEPSTSGFKKHVVFIATGALSGLCVLSGGICLIVNALQGVGAG